MEFPNTLGRQPSLSHLVDVAGRSFDTRVHYWKKSPAEKVANAKQYDQGNPTYIPSAILLHTVQQLLPESTVYQTSQEPLEHFTIEDNEWRRGTVHAGC